MYKFRMRYAPIALTENLESHVENLADSRKAKDVEMFLATKAGSLFQLAGFIPVDAASNPTVQSLFDLKRAYALDQQMTIRDVPNNEIVKYLRKARTVQLKGRAGGPLATWETITNAN